MLARALIVGVAVGIVIVGAHLGRIRERRRAALTLLDVDGLEGRVLFFTDAACRRCDVVRGRLESIDAVFEEIAFGHEPDLQRSVGVTAVPLLVVRDNSGAIVDRVAGVASVRRIRRALSLAG